MARGRGRWLGVLAGSVFAGALLLTPDPGPVPALRLGVFDTYQWLLPRTRISSPAVIIAVDDSSLVQFGQWPWPRDLVARLITLIAARNAAAIGIDIVFAEPDRVSPERIADALRARDPAIAERLLKLRPNDEILAEAIAQAPVVLGVAGMPVPTFVQPPGVTARMVG
ncbi:MAG TPA: CHASE2 domain-containing protein, partial [Burkholderiales bacterium]|nr:CHASE2 domain-containing protein [Burkholderiales bacterium]